MFFWTHFFDIIAKVAAIGMAVAIPLALKETAPQVPFLWLFLGSFAIAVIVWLSLLRPLSSWCYARFRLRTKLTFFQAMRASMLFSPIRDVRKWHPLRQALQLPESGRASFVMEAADEVADYYAGRSREWAEAPLYAKGFRAFFWLSVPGTIACLELHLPPVQWLVTLQQQLIGSYHPVISLLLVIVPLSLVLHAIERRLRCNAFLDHLSLS